MAVTFHKGESLAVDYTPNSAVTAGDAIVRGSNVFFAKSDIAASALGAVDICGQWKGPKAAGGSTGWFDGNVLYWDASGAKFTKTAGSNNKFSMVEETRPPMMMAAIGPMISRPGLSLSKAIGSMASAVTSAVINMDGKRSWAPSFTVAADQICPSCSTRCR